MLQIAICDDECYYRVKIQRLLENYLKSHQLIYNICFFTSGEEFLSQSKNSVKRSEERRVGKECLGLC